MSNQKPKTKFSINRRRILRTVGASAVTGSVLTGSVAASSKPEKDEQCDCPGGGQILEEDGDSAIVAFDEGQHMDVFIVDKRGKSVSYERYPSQEDEANVLNEDIVPMDGHDDIITDYQGWGGSYGSCSLPIYANHLEGGVAMEFGSSIGDFSDNVVANAICAVIGSAGGYVGIIISAFGCAVIQTFVLPEIDTDGNILTVGIYDCHGGILNQPSICLGGSDEFVTSSNDLDQLNRYNALHMEQYTTP